MWRSDGTDTGTVPVISVGATPGGCDCGLEIEGSPELTTSAEPSISRSRRAVAPWPPSGTNCCGAAPSPTGFAAAGKTLYFQSSDKKHGAELWRSDGTRRGTRMVRDIRRGKESSNIWELTAVGKTLFFRADDGVHGHELWRAGPKPCKAAKGKCKKKG